MNMLYSSVIQYLDISCDVSVTLRLTAQEPRPFLKLLVASNLLRSVWREESIRDQNMRHECDDLTRKCGGLWR